MSCCPGLPGSASLSFSKVDPEIPVRLRQPDDKEGIKGWIKQQFYLLNILVLDLVSLRHIENL